MRFLSKHNAAAAGFICIEACSQRYRPGSQLVSPMSDQRQSSMSYPRECGTIVIDSANRFAIITGA
jgi:hypothetical protein